MFKLFIISLFSINLLAASYIKREVYPLIGETLRAKSYDFELKFLYSQTQSRFDTDGVEVPLQELEAYSLIDTDISINYGYSNKVQIFATGRYRQFSAEDATDTTTKAGFESLGLGFKYSLKGSPRTKYAVSGSYRKTMYENEVYSSSGVIPGGELALGDSGNSFDLNFHLSYLPKKSSVFEMSFGYRTPPNDLSPELPYDVSFTKRFRRWAMWAGVKGIYSLNLDPYTDNPQEKPANASMGSFRFNSINRSYIQPYGGFRYLVSNKYRSTLEVGRTISGSSVDQSFDFTFKVAWTTGGKSKEHEFESSFKQYTAEATVLKVSPRGKFLKIDRGLAQDIAKGARVDIYKADFFGGNVLVASGVIYESGPSWAIVRLLKKYRSLPIDKGFTARIK